MNFICPLCKRPLADIDHSLRCENRHCFDRAKSGYVNLLPDGSKNSKLPGDNKLMVHARRDFLEKEYYKPLCDAVCAEVVLQLHGKNSPVVLDTGCGEGYYTNRVEETLHAVMPAEILGVDISKFAVDVAAKKNKRVNYATGSIFHLPVAKRSCDVILNLFAPYCGEEFQRVLCEDGLLFVIIPGALHLWELKQSIYDEPYQNEVKDYALDGFSLINRLQISEKITLSSNQDIENLFTMTPYYYKTSAENAARLHELDSLTTKIEFEILVYRSAQPSPSIAETAVQNKKEVKPDG